MLYLLGQLPQVALGYLKHDQVQIKMCYKCKILLQDYKDLLTSECVCVWMCGCTVVPQKLCGKRKFKAKFVLVQIF